MIIKVVDETGEDKYLVEASYIKWSKNEASYCIAVFPIITKTNSVNQLRKSETEVSCTPSIYIHVNHGYTVYVMNDAGKTVDKKHIVIEAKTEDEALKMREYETEHNPDHQ